MITHQFEGQLLFFHGIDLFLLQTTFLLSLIASSRTNVRFRAFSALLAQRLPFKTLSSSSKSSLLPWITPR